MNKIVFNFNTLMIRYQGIQLNNKTFIKVLFVLGVLFYSLTSCNAINPDFKIQDDDTNKINKPKINVKVNKQYDDKGNLIKFDSSYSYSYSEGFPENVNMDSLFNEFKPYFFNHSPEIINRSFDDHLFDTIPNKNDFFEDDYFFKNFQDEQFLFKEMLKEMDSIKNLFFNNSYNIKNNQEDNEEQEY